ncbi:hypothetical protein AY610_19530 [Bacillus velezensis]|nr:hypothetical protein AY610_19530 [Bacillus velezensis]
MLNTAGAERVFSIFGRSLIGGKIGSAESGKGARIFDGKAGLREPRERQVDGAKGMGGKNWGEGVGT